MPREDTKIYIGNLPSDVRERDLEDLFSKYGRIRMIDIKGGRGPLYAFVEYEDYRDAEDAIRGRDGYDFDGHRLRVEITRGVGPRGPGGRPLNGDRHDPGFRPRGGPPSKRTNYRVIVEGLPSSGSWQDLKDHMREAGEVCYADVARDGTGVVEYSRYEDMKYALKKLDDTKFRSHEGDSAYITVREDTSSSSASRRSRSRSRSARRSPKYSPARRSPSRSRSRSHSRSRSRS